MKHLSFPQHFQFLDKLQISEEYLTRIGGGGGRCSRSGCIPVSKGEGSVCCHGTLPRLGSNGSMISGFHRIPARRRYPPPFNSQEPIYNNGLPRYHEASQITTRVSTKMAKMMESVKSGTNATEGRKWKEKQRPKQFLHQ